MSLTPTPHSEGTGLDSLSFLWLEVTGKCNLQCVHCYADSGPRVPTQGQMEASNWKKVLRESFELGCRSVQFIGGEPTAYPHLDQLVAYARGVGHEFIEVFTNGTLIKDRLLDIFREHSVNLALSFYASQADVHDNITQQTGSFERTLRGIQRAIDAGLGVRAGITKMRENANNYEDAKDLLREMGVSQISIDRVRNVGRGNRTSTNENLYHDLCGNCWRGKLCVDPKGQVFPCVFSRFCQVGSIHDGLDQILSGSSLFEFRRTMYDALECEYPDARTNSIREFGRPGFRQQCPPNPCPPMVPQPCLPSPCLPLDCLPTPCVPSPCLPNPTPCIPTPIS